MTNEELIRTLKHFEKDRVERLNDNAKRLFYAIMKIVDERDEYKRKTKKALKIIDSYNLGKYDYSIPPGGIIELKDVLEEKRRKNDRGI